ncbi:hypothetical protein [Kineosporia sp. R_H_3]|uniref:hypothetical protein n=1 Tax=Kineosporia sp. R_H_3 TaxID=1961848 RepID=UPI00130441B0|nr:hypothetical protein [Kineosporia sp. R_H_3]MBI4942485.1 hypothetical protein [Actinomycetota bacterium]
MCHVVNAHRGSTLAAVDRPDGWFADQAVPRLLSWAGRLDRHLPGWEIKVFGGGRQTQVAVRGLDIPGDNLAAVRLHMTRAGLEAVAWHVGGTGSRMVLLDIATGGVWLSHRPRPDLHDPRLPLRVSRPPGATDAPATARILRRLPN